MLSPDRAPHFYHSAHRPPGARRLLTALFFFLLCVAIIPSIFTGCQPDPVTETASFEAAELAYRQGHYKEAIDGYEQFLTRYGQSPMASLAALRIRTINREVSSMLGRKETPPPIYRGASRDAMKIAAPGRDAAPSPPP